MGKLTVVRSPANETPLFIDSVNNENSFLTFANRTVEKYSIGFEKNDGSYYLQDDSANAKRMVVDASGNVGIGTTTPWAKLHVQGPGTSTSPVELLRLTDLSQKGSGDNRGVSLTFNGKADVGREWGRITGLHHNVGNGVNGALAFSTFSQNGGPTERMRIDSFGHVGIGTVSPEEKLHVDGNIKAAQICDHSGQCRSIQKLIHLIDDAEDSDQLSNDLMAHYSFDKRTNLGFDSSGNQSHSYAYVKATDGKLGRAANFDYNLKNIDPTIGPLERQIPGNIYIEAPGPLFYHSDEPFTFATWVRFDDTSRAFSPILIL